MDKAITLNEILADKEGTVTELSFEQGLALLEELVEKVETGALPLETALTAYERGAAIIKHLRGLLSGAEKKLKVICKESEKEP